MERYRWMAQSEETTQCSTSHEAELQSGVQYTSTRGMYTDALPYREYATQRLRNTEQVTQTEEDSTAHDDENENENENADANK